MSKIDFVLYSDTDSLFINIGGFLDNNIGTDWHSLPDDKKVFYIKKICSNIEEHVNDHCYRDTQRKSYNSPVTDFRIKWKQEVIAKAALFISKKRYSMFHVDEEGATVDKIKNVGLEIVRSDTASAIKPRLKEIVDMILRGVSDNELKSKIMKHKKEIAGVYPEEIALNVGISDIEKYEDKDGNSMKGTPMHTKGAINQKKLVKMLKLENKIDFLSSGVKAKVVYVKKNMLGIESLAFTRWPKEFDDIVEIDYQLHISKFYTDKIKTLLEPMGKGVLLNDNSGGLDLFF